MKVIRCKDCALVNTLACPMNYIDKQKGIVSNRTQTFFCAHAQPTAQYEPTHGDTIRNMSDSELADFLYKIEMQGYEMRGYEGKSFSKTNIRKHYKKYVKTPLSEDIE